MPQTLRDIVTGGQSGFEVRIGYYLRVKCDSMGVFPGMITDSSEIILVFDLELLSSVWESMPPKDSEVASALFFVNKQVGIAFDMSIRDLEEMSSRQSIKVFTRADFERLTANGASPFSWASGIFGAVIDLEEFARLRKRELAKLRS